MTLGQALNHGQNLLHNSPSAQLDAELLLAKTLKLSRSQLLARSGEKISWVNWLQWRWKIYQRQRGLPIAYITGQKEFYGRNFLANHHVLIPRPDTELLIEQSLSIIDASAAIDTIVDIGTGSGCLAVTLALEKPSLKVIATDISRAALKLARRNAARYGLMDRLTFRRGNLLEPFLTAGRSLSDNCLLVANLPYLRTAEVKDELRFEPRLALDGGADGLTGYRELLTQLRAVPQLQRPGWLLFEIHPPTAGPLVQLVKDVFPGIQASVKNDYAGWPRVLSVHLAVNN